MTKATHNRRIRQRCFIHITFERHFKNNSYLRPFLVNMIPTKILTEYNYHHTLKMPSRLPNFQISNFLTNNTVPIPLSSLTDPNCPICLVAFDAPPTTHVHPDHLDGLPDYAVRIYNRSPCFHVFGRRCLEAHIRSGTPWSHTCPLCRAEWFPAPHSGRREALINIESALMGLARVDVRDEEIGREVANVERALLRVREVLYGWRWI